MVRRPRGHRLVDRRPRIYAGAVKFRWPEPFLVVLRNHMAAQSIDLPLPSITTGGGKGGAQIYLAEPFVMSGQGDGAPRSIDAPMPGMTASLGSALIAPYYGSGSGETCGSAETPMPTVTTKARFGLVVPVTHGAGGPGPRALDEPLPTLTTAKGGEFALVEGAADGRRYDIRFRMLEPRELARAMGFDDGEAEYEFAGTKTDITRQIGNAVPVNTACALVRAIMAH